MPNPWTKSIPLPYARITEIRFPGLALNCLSAAQAPLAVNLLCCVYIIAQAQPERK